MNWHVYILRCGDGTFYTGITNNLDERINAHENGRAAKYTKSRGPFTVVYKRECDNRSAALKREAEIKKLSRDEKIKLSMK